MSQRTTPKGYKRLTTHVNGVKRLHFAHVLICSAFHGTKPSAKLMVRHLDGQPAHNVPDNIRWGTQSENELDKIRHGTNRNSAKTECSRGHEFTGANLTWVRLSTGHSRRQCNACTREYQTARRAAKRAA